LGEYDNVITIKTQKHIFNVELKADFVKHDVSHILQGNSSKKQSRVTCLGRKY